MCTIIYGKTIKSGKKAFYNLILALHTVFLISYHYFTLLTMKCLLFKITGHVTSCSESHYNFQVFAFVVFSIQVTTIKATQ